MYFNYTGDEYECIGKLSLYNGYNKDELINTYQLYHKSTEYVEVTNIRVEIENYPFTYLHVPTEEEENCKYHNEFLGLYEKKR